MRKNLLRAAVLSLSLAFIMPELSVFNNVITAEAASKPTLNKRKATLKEGKKIALTVKKPTEKVKWSTSNKKIARVISTKGSKKQSAVIQGKKSGRATITAKVGSTKLKATITVKHVHNFRYPATCTAPARCACGATSGYALGHNWVGASCTKAAACSRCRAVGTKLPHSWISGNCRYCNEIDLPYFVEISISNPGNTTRQVDLYVENSGNKMLRICSGDERIGSGIVYTSANAAPKKLGLCWGDSYESYVELEPGYFCRTYNFADAGPMVLGLDCRLEFEVTYNYKRYRVVVYGDRKVYDYTRLS